MHQVKTGSVTMRVDARLIESVCDELARQVEPEELELAVRFAQSFLADSPPGFFVGRDPKALAQATLGAFRSVQRARSAGAEGGDRTVEAMGEYAVRRPERAIQVLESMAAKGDVIAIRFSNPDAADRLAFGEPVTELKLYLRGERLVLSDFMPILESVGLRVIAVSPFEVHGEGVDDATIYLFAVQDAAGQPLDLERTELLSEAILAVRAGEATNDSLNALVLDAGLAWREVDVLRAYAEYAFQAGAVPARLALPTALRAYPETARIAFRLFEAKFDPSTGKSPAERAEELAAIRAEFLQSLEKVSSLADDRALRRLLMLIEATTRTNYYRHGGAKPTFRSGGAPYISLKFACNRLEGINTARLLYEVWVQSARMAGVHFRGAMVARGGIRHSDRPDDFRTEVLGLVKTQNIKNAVIVPAGSKGGFVTRIRHADPQAMGAEAVEQYRTYIRGLLDITDNLVDGKIVQAPGVVAYDELDPYLVVAADKGTARFSDIANAVAAEYNFWLDDAFASGGSNGYDHKKVGITARGGWECVKRHFLEMGKDIQTEPFTVVGIGDMSGDVFGNGMLLSRQIRLIAAFDHRHVFIDPNPDPEKSYEERKRLAGLTRSSWDDYDRSLLSEGGLIVPRGAKAVELTPQVREVLGLGDDVTVLDGESLIRAVLAAPVDLIWNGGIGTYIKASTESHADVGDPSNDAVRVNASEIRARVIGEGGNLGVTQRARIEYALAGGRNNTDALDNSGGVDMSDREVNLKIFLNAAMTAGKMDREERNRLLEELTPAVTELVLDDNRSQSMAVSLDEIRAQSSVEDFQYLMVRLEKDGLLSRAADILPTLEVLNERRARGASLTRPELAVLLAYAKLALKRGILESTLPDDPAAEEYLLRYFPAGAIEAAGTDALASHRLRREIIASQITNDLTDLMGAGFVFRLVRDTGHSPADVARAWLIASRMAGARTIRENLAELTGKVEMSKIYRWLLGLARVLERTTRWALANVPSDAPATSVIDEYRPALDALQERFGEVVDGAEKEIYEARVAELQGLTENPELARRLITLRFLDHLLEILSVARATDADPLRVGRIYYQVSELVGASWLRQALAEATGGNRWDQRAAAALTDELGRTLRSLIGAIANADGTGDSADAVAARLGAEAAGKLAAYRELLDEIRAEDRPGLSALTVATRELQALAAAV